MNDLDISVLRTFLLCVDLGGFGKAGRARNLSQPTVSQQIQGLERQLGAALFERKGRGRALTLSTFGEQVLIEARTLIDAHDRALTRLLSNSRTAVSVGVTPDALAILGPDLVERLRAIPGLADAKLTVGDNAALHNAFDNGRIDIGILLDLAAGATTLPGGQVVRFDWYAAPRYSFERNNVTVVEHGGPGGVSARGIDILVKHGYEITDRIVAQDETAAIATAAAGLGIALLRSRRRVDGLDVRRDLPFVPPLGIQIMATQGDALAPILQSLIHRDRSMPAAWNPNTSITTTDARGS